MSELESTVADLVEGLEEHGRTSFSWSEPRGHFAIWDSYGRTNMYFNLGASRDENRRIAVEKLAAEFGLKCRKVRGTDGFDSLKLDLSRTRDELSGVLERVLTDICGIKD